MAPSAQNIETTFVIDNFKDEYHIKVHPAKSGAEYGKILVQQALQEHISSIDPATCEAGEEDAFFVADMGEVYRQHKRWKKNLPRVKPHYGERSVSWSRINLC